MDFSDWTGKERFRLLAKRALQDLSEESDFDRLTAMLGAALIPVAEALREPSKMARYKLDGELDPTFGVNAKTVTDFSGHSDYAVSIALQSDGRIVLAGASKSTSDSKTYDFALARYTVEPDFAD